nr:hypothetical protein [Tanacetum cinerariifolium]
MCVKPFVSADARSCYDIKLRDNHASVPSAELERYLQSVPKVAYAAVIPSRMESKLAVVMVRPRTILVATILLLQLRFIKFHRFAIKMHMLAVVKTRQSIFFMHE